MIRMFLAFLQAVAFSVLSPFLWLIVLILRLFSQKAADRFAVTYIQGSFLLFRYVTGVKLTVTGRENLITDRSVLYVMNHRSFFDVILTYPMMKRLTGFVAKIEFKKIPIIAQWLPMCNSLYLDRKDIRQGLKTILAATEKIKNGISMVIFPEGTRNKDADPSTMLPFHDASLKPAKTSGCPVIPIALYNTAECFENHKPMLKPARVHIVIGKPVTLSELDPEAQKRPGLYFQNVIQEMLNGIRDSQAE